jgi:hypothetical protein
MAGWIDPKTQRATAFYCLLGVLCSNIYHVGINQWNFSALVLMTGIGTLSGLTHFVQAMKKIPVDPPDDGQ